MTATPLTDPALRIGADLHRWIERGGGRCLTAAAADPVATLDLVRAAGVAGMGGAMFPTADKWAPVADADDPDRWVICNGNEDEPGTFKDIFLLVNTPHQVIEGALVAAVVVGAADVVVYTNPRSPEVAEAVTAALAQWRSHPLLARTEGTVGHPLRLHHVQSNGLYVAGEETAVISTVEGRFPFPRRKPPFPAQHGVHGHPTVVNNVETLAHVYQSLRLGPAAWRDLGAGDAPGTKLYSLTGDVLRPGLYELPFGTSLGALVEDHGGGMLAGAALKAVFTGGPSNTLLTADDLDVVLEPVALARRGSRLGTGAMIVVGEGTSIVRKLAEYMSFYRAGSCGQCPPCSIGTHEAHRLLARLDSGLGTTADLDALIALGPLMFDSGNCGLVDGAATVLMSSLATFGDEYRSHVTDP